MSSRQSIQLPPMNSLSALADPPQRHIDSAAMDYFLIEMVNTLKTSAAVATTRAKKLEQEMIEAGLAPPPVAVPPPLPLKKESARDSVTSLASRSGSVTGKAVLDEDEEALRVRLENIGSHVGANITEKCVSKLAGHSYSDSFPGCVEIEECLQTRWTLLNSSAKISGSCSGTNRLIIYEQTIEYVFQILHI